MTAVAADVRSATLGCLLLPFAGIKAVDLAISALHLV